jgi:hydroxymethylpyrimidine/phosphomethylpyrimidine kinase
VAPIALTIAGSDPSGGAGLQADLKTFHQHGVYGQAVVTLLTVQNTVRVSRVEPLDDGLVVEQLRAVLEDLPPAAAKTGALGSAATVRAIAREAGGFSFPLVVDPVMISKHGAPLMSEEAAQTLVNDLLPCAALVTPNLHEAAALSGRPAGTIKEMRLAAQVLRERTGAAVLVKGGHLEGSAVDLLLVEGVFHEFPGARIETPHTHGTGCTYSAAITANLARGLSLLESVARARHFIAEAIATNPGLGHGHGPVNHFASIF